MTRGRGKVRAGALDFSALEGCAGFRGHPSPVRTAHIPSFLPHAGVSWLPLFRFSVTSEFPHRPEALASGSATPWAHGPRGPHPHPIATPTSINRAGVLWGGWGGSTPGLSGEAQYRARARARRVPGRGDPGVASVRHGDAAAPAHSLPADGRASALTWLTL